MTERQSYPPQDQPMTRGERTEFAQFTRQYVRGLKARGEEHAAVLVAMFEEELAREWDPKEAQWNEAIEVALQAVTDANSRIREYFEEKGLNLKRAPELKLMWSRRGENSEKERREELRGVAKAQADAVRKKAVAEGERLALDVQTQLMVSDHTRAEAQALIFDLPKIDKLMPPLKLEQVLAIAQGRDRLRSPWEGRLWPELEAGEGPNDDQLGDLPF